ncbi:MAG: FAD-dependent oxidoreductase [Saprospiraceae bacterium]|nr:FAD-dependent oxidoreductase [Saprospiraceae bacterium]
MKRRAFLKLSGSSLAALQATTLTAKPYPRWSGQNVPEIIVIGAGTFGVWTAYHLNRLGAKVTLLDAYGPGNSRASSGGETRLIQVDNDNPVYVRSAIRAFDWWKKMEEESGEQLVLPTGRLAMSTDDAHREVFKARKKQLQASKVENTEVLDHSEIAYRWPQIHTANLAVAMYNDGGSSGSTLMARKGCQVVARQLEKNGGSIQIAQAKPKFEPNGSISGVMTADGRILQAQMYVFACGPWLPKLFPKVLFPKLQVQRRDVLFVGIPPGDNRFSFPNLPEWSVSGSGYYGFPDIEARGLKVAPYPDHNDFDPDLDERLTSLYQVKRAHDFVRHRFPALADQPIVETRVCQVTNSIDGNFIVDQYPESPNTWIIGAGSGHGFKHGPAVGEYAAERILGNGGEEELDKTFKLKAEAFSK